MSSTGPLLTLPPEIHLSIVDHLELYDIRALRSRRRNFGTLIPPPTANITSLPRGFANNILRYLEFYEVHALRSTCRYFMTPALGDIRLNIFELALDTHNEWAQKKPGRPDAVENPDVLSWWGRGGDLGCLSLSSTVH